MKVIRRIAPAGAMFRAPLRFGAAPPSMNLHGDVHVSPAEPLTSLLHLLDLWVLENSSLSTYLKSIVVADSFRLQRDLDAVDAAGEIVDPIGSVEISNPYGNVIGAPVFDAFRNIASQINETW